MPKKRFADISDRHLLNLLKEDNRLAFSELYNRYWEALYQFGFSVLQDENSAKDVVQDIFFYLWRKRKTLNIQNLAPYLFMSVKFEVTRQLKKGRLTESHEEYFAKVPTVNSVEEMINFKELDQQVKKVVDSLPEKSKEVFYLSRYGHQSNKEIAEKLGISQRTVEWHISSALHSLRLFINKASVLILSINLFS